MASKRPEHCSWMPPALEVSVVRSAMVRANEKQAYFEAKGDDRAADYFDGIGDAFAQIVALMESPLANDRFKEDADGL